MPIRNVLAAPALCAALLMSASARAHGPSDASTLSLLPLAVSVAAPVAVVSAGAVLTVVAVEASALGTVWVLERASDGARVSMELTGTSLVAAGTALHVTSVEAGHVLSAAGRVVCFVPNALGQALLHNERITR